MNKTVNINLGGWFFHIDENAYEKLSQYLAAVKNSLQDPDSQDEIMKDIELRMAELLTTKNGNNQQVISMAQVEEIIAILGQPEVYSMDNEEQTAHSAASNAGATTNRRTRKLYRDADKSMVAGVCGGLGHYLGIDPVWLRILFLSAVLFSFGTMVIVYLVLWICVPEARTTAEKLEMMGDPVNISNIEKKVKEEFNTVSDRLKNVDYDKMGRKIEDGVNRGIKNATDTLNQAGSTLGKLFGGLVLAISSILLVAIIIGWVAFTKLSYEGDWNTVITPMNHTEAPLWVLQLVGFLLVFIPFLALWIWGLRKLNPHFKPLHPSIKWTLGIAFTLCILAATYFGIRQGAEYTSENKVLTRYDLTQPASDTLRIKWLHHSQFTNSPEEYEHYKLVDINGKDHIFSNRVQVVFKPTSENTPYIQVEREADGTNLKSSLKRAERIDYQWNAEGHELKLNNYFLTPIEERFADQNVTIYVYLPKGTVFTADYALKDRNYSNSEYFELNREARAYKVEEQRIRPLGLLPEIGEGVIGTIEGTGTIESNSFNSENSNPTNPVESAKPTPDANAKTGTIIMGPDGILIKK